MRYHIGCAEQTNSGVGLPTCAFSSKEWELMNIMSIPRMSTARFVSYFLSENVNEYVIASPVVTNHTCIGRYLLHVC